MCQVKIERGLARYIHYTPVMEPNNIIKSSLIYDGTSLKVEQAVKAWQIYQEFLKQLAATSEPGLEFEFELRMTVSISAVAEPVLEHPPLPASPPPEPADDDDEPTCDICGYVPPWREMDTERGICMTCAEHFEDSLKYYTEEFAHASANGKDALSLLVLRQRADNCRDFIAAAAASYDGDLEAHEARVEEKMLNKRAAECLGRLPASFAPWWKDTWTHEKWCQIDFARETTGCAVASKDTPIVQRLAAMFVAEQHKVRELKKTHAEVLANIERAREEDMQAVEARHQREMEGLRNQLRAAEAGCEKKCHDANRRGYAMGYAFADEKATKVIEAVRADLQRLSAENKELRQQIEEDKQMVDRHLKEVAKEHAGITAWEKKEIERLTAENKGLERRVAEESHWCKHANMAARTAEMHAQMLRTDVAELKKMNETLLELVGPTQKLMTSNPELFGGEARGTSLPSPPPIVHLPPIKEENKEKPLSLLERLMARPQACGLVESTPTALPDIVEVEPPTEDICMALSKAQYEEMVKAAAVPTLLAVPHECTGHTTPGGVPYKHAAPFSCTTTPPPPASPPPSPIIVPDQPTACGAAGCIDCPPLEPVAVAEAAPDTTQVSCVGFGKPKPNYNHPNWPSPITKRFAKHIANYAGKDPKTIKTHEDALEYIAKRAKISVDTLLDYSIKQYQLTFEGWSLLGEPWASPKALYFRMK
jgi:hypothetical protein